MLGRRDVPFRTKIIDKKGDTLSTGVFAFWLLTVVVLVAVVGAVLGRRLRSLETELRQTREQMAALTRRVFELERPAPPTPVPLPPPLPETKSAPPLPPPLPQPSVFQSPAVQEPAPVMQDRLRQRLTAEEWEALVGGSWLNRLGVLILVIGIALFLGYTLTRLGPAGKISTGVAVSLAMLGAGVALERQERYANFARGLIGGGWAALYFTVFAMYGLEAARVISSPALGMALLLAVAAGMILHSFRYRSQVVTGLAYFAAFAALKLGPPTTFAVAASIPLVLSLVLVAQRFVWIPLAAAGLALTYLVYGLDYRASFELENPLLGEPVLWIYWLLFEAFDIVEQRRRGGASSLGQSIFGLNAVGFVGASLLTWAPVNSAALARFLAVASAAFLASALVRVRVLPARAGSEDEPWLGVWEPAVTASAMLALFAIVRRFSGIGITIGLLMEAEFVALAGIALRSLYLRRLGMALFLVPVARICLVDYEPSDKVVQFGISMRRATPITVLAAALAWVNRRLHATPVYSVAGTLLLAIMVAVEVSKGYIGLSYLAIAAVLAVAAARTRAYDLIAEACVMGAASTGVLLTFTVFDRQAKGGVVSLAAAVVVLYAGGALLRRRFPKAAEFPFAVASLYVASLAWRTLPENAIVPAWAALGLIWLIAGLRWSAALRACAYSIALAALMRVMLVSFRLPDEPARIATAASAAAFFYAEQFLTPRGGDRFGRQYFSILGTATITLLLFHEVSGRMLTVALGLQGVTLLIAGFALRERVLRISGLVLFFFCILKLFVYDLRQLDTFSRIVSFIALGLLLVGASWVYTRFREQIRKLL